MTAAEAREIREKAVAEHPDRVRREAERPIQAIDAQIRSAAGDRQSGLSVRWENDALRVCSPDVRQYIFDHYRGVGFQASYNAYFLELVW